MESSAEGKEAMLDSFLGLVLLTKVLQGVVGGFFRGLDTMPKIFSLILVFFFPGYALLVVVYFS